MLSSADPAQSLKKVQSFFKQQISKMKEYSEQAKEIKDLIKGYKSSAETQQRQLLKQLQHINVERARHEDILKQFEAIHKNQLLKGASFKTEYTEKKKQRVSLAEKINIKQLTDLHIEDRKSEAHEVFKWILSVIYREPVGKYYWNNFKEQAFKEDKGVDFKERMGKISATDLKEDEKVTTKKLVDNRDALINHVDFDGTVRENIKNIIQIAQLIFEGSEIARKTKQLQTEDTKSRDERILKEQMLKKSEAKCVAMKDRIKLIQKYIQTLSTISKTMDQKVSRYSEGNKEGTLVVNELRSLENEKGKSSYLERAVNDPSACLLF